MSARATIAISVTVLVMSCAPLWRAGAAEPGRPSARPLPEPVLLEPEALVELLPPIPPRRAPKPTTPDASDASLTIERWVFSGNTVFTQAELADVVAPWTGRAVRPEDLSAARDALTLHYVEAGYVTSGALIPSQEVEDGVVRIQIVEGRLDEIEISGDGRLRDVYLRRRLELRPDSPLHVPTLERRIRRLQQDERIDRIDASLRPGSRLGRARLEAEVIEAFAWDVSLEASNHIAPSLGDVRGRLGVRHVNVSGLGDEAFLSVGGYEAGPEVEAGYRVPITRWDTTLGVQGRWTESDLVDRIGDALDVEGEFWNVELDLRQPVYRTPRLELAIGVTSALRQSATDILGEPFDEVGSRTRVFVLRFYQELLWRDANQVLSARSTTNVGVDLFGATTASRSDVPDGRFVSWLAQAQWLRRFTPWDLEILVRGEVQLTEDPLLSPEQYSSGGHATVRGYRENQIVRDQGGSGSIELRVPVWRDPVDGRTLVQLAPFFDVGGGWNRNRPTLSPTTLYSAGLTLRLEPWPFLRGELTWAERLADVERPEGLQGDGVQFRVVIDLL